MAWREMICTVLQIRASVASRSERWVFRNQQQTTENSRSHRTLMSARAVGGVVLFSYWDGSKIDIEALFRRQKKKQGLLLANHVQNWLTAQHSMRETRDVKRKSR